MSSMSDYLESSLINATLRGTNFTAPSVGALHVGLFTADPTDANVTANEVGAAWYSRKPSGTWTSPANGASTNTTVVNFDPVTGATITITHMAIYDASTAGNMLYHAPLALPKTLDPGDVLSFAIGSLSVTLQ